MRGFIILFCCVWSSTAVAQCFSFFTLNAVGTNATAVFEGSGAENPLYVIDWGDGQIDTSLVPVMEHSYATDGYYVATYYYSDQNDPNCSFYSFEAFILTGASCSLNVQTTAIAQAVVVEALAQNTSVPLVSIDWGDGSPLLLDNNGIHAYASPGLYEVCVSLVDGDPAFPCDLTECQMVEVLGTQGSCEISFEPTIQGQQVSLVLNTPGPADTPYWIDWGDGTYSDYPAVTHTYNVPAYYTICLYYGEPGDLSCQASFCQEIFIDPFASDCVLQMVPLVDGPDVDLQVLAAGADAPIFFVDWGDGSDGEFGFPQGYTYNASGTYLVCISYTDSLNPIGCQLNDCQEVTVEVNANPCTVSLAVVNVGLENTYSSLAVGEGAAQPFYTITWGDNSAALLANSGEYTYANPGAYEICATYGDSLNPECNATACETVNVLASVEELTAHLHLQASPIPLTNETIIEFQVLQPGKVHIAVYDVFGRCVATVFTGETGQELHRLRWDSSALAQGQYTLCLTSRGIRRVVPLMK
ncbi:MAG: hypothetical protein ACK478_10195 [Flavobacteriales bacterium]|jgi:hypothetical protein